jgi:dolichol-phosphate mannosyltransferase
MLTGNPMPAKKTSTSAKKTEKMSKKAAKKTANVKKIPAAVKTAKKTAPTPSNSAKKIKPPLLSIIVPTYKEAKNAPVLCEQLNEILVKEHIRYEIIIVDDNSNDGIDTAVTALQKKKLPVTLKIRTHERGLSSAVLAGFAIAKGEIFMVMDADLSHPPQRVPAMVKTITEQGADFVIGSRFVKGGGTPHFNVYRKMNALVSRLLARPLADVKDPMAGFFAFPSRILDHAGKFNPLGWKIGLEVLVKCAPKKMIEIPIQFQERLYGESKLSLREQLHYLLHLKRLYEYKFKTLTRFAIFSFIGGTGSVIDLTTIHIIYKKILLPNGYFHNYEFEFARSCGFLLALTSNFFLNRKITFHDMRGHRIMRQYVTFLALGLVAGTVNWLLSVRLHNTVAFFGEHYLLSAVMGIIAGTVINFFGSKSIVFKK